MLLRFVQTTLLRPSTNASITCLLLWGRDEDAKRWRERANIEVGGTLGVEGMLDSEEEWVEVHVFRFVCVRDIFQNTLCSFSSANGLRGREIASGNVRALLRFEHTFASAPSCIVVLSPCEPS